MSGLAQIRKHMWHKISPGHACSVNISIQDLQQFSYGYIPLPNEKLKILAHNIWNGKKRYDPASDSLIDINTCM